MLAQPLRERDAPHLHDAYVRWCAAGRGRIVRGPTKGQLPVVWMSAQGPLILFSSDDRTRPWRGAFKFRWRPAT
eukprot:scaffold67728_cov28-Tisochrysis_lutea.AAC.2